MWGDSNPRARGAPDRRSHDSANRAQTLSPRQTVNPMQPRGTRAWITKLTGAAARAAVAHARLVLVASWILALGAAWFAARLPVRGDFSDLLPPNAPSVRHLHALQRRTRVLATYMIGVESDTAATRAAAAHALLGRVRHIDPHLISGVTADHGVERRFTWAHRFLYASLSDLKGARDALERRIAQANPLYISFEDKDRGPSVDQLRARLDRAKAKAETPAPLVSHDGRLQLILVRASFTSDETALSHQLTGQLRRAAAATRAQFPGVRIGMTGDAVTVGAEHRAIISGMLVSTVVTVVLVLVALLLFFRSLWLVGALSWSLSVGVLVTFAFTDLTIGHLNLASAFLSAIVIGNGINFGLMLMSRYSEERRGQAAVSEAIVRAAQHSAPGTLTAALTAAVAYGALATTQFRGFRDFGIIGAVGMLLCWLSAYTVLPAALAWVGERVRAESPARLGGWLLSVVPARPRVLAAVGLGLAALTCAGTLRFLTHDPLEDNLRNLRSSTAELRKSRAWMNKFDHAFGYGISGGFVVAVPRQSEAPAVAAELRRVDAGRPVAQHLFSRISTIQDLLPKQQSKKLVVLAQIRHLFDGPLRSHLSAERWRELRPPDHLRALTARDLPDQLAWPYTERDGTRGRLIFFNTGLGVDMWRISSLEHFAHVVRGLHLGPHVLVGGSAFVFSDMLAAMERDGPRATFAALFGALLVVLALLGTGRHARITLACAGLGTLSMLSAAWLLGIKVNFLDFVALPITIGIGVDYAANIVARARQTTGPGAGRRALGGTGTAVVLCSYTTVVGYASLLFSHNRGIHTFGLSAMIGELTCLSAAVLFAPALLDLCDRSVPREVGALTTPRGDGGIP